MLNILARADTVRVWVLHCPRTVSRRSGNLDTRTGRVPAGFNAGNQELTQEPSIPETQHKQACESTEVHENRLRNPATRLR